MRKIFKKYEINASLGIVWKVLTDVELIEQWTGSLAKMSQEKGEEFFLWNRDIWGVNIEVVPQKKLVQEWYAGNWKKPSIVRFHLCEKNRVTTLELLHTDIPEEEAEGIDRGWDEYYLSQVKNLAEYLQKSPTSSTASAKSSSRKSSSA